MRNATILIIMFLFYNLGFSQAYINVRLKNLDLLDERLKNFKISINDQEINFDRKENRVLILPKKRLDKVVLSYNERTRISYAKFKEGENYVLSINPCSTYTLYPENNMKIGTFSVVKNKAKNGALLNVCSFEYELGKGKMYLNERCNASAMCFFSSKEILIKQEEEIIDNFNFHFLHGENLLLKVYKNKLRFNIE